MMQPIVLLVQLLTADAQKLRNLASEPACFWVKTELKNDIDGKDIISGSPDVASAAECNEICTDDSTCMFWSWSSSNKRCYLKSELGEKVASEEATSGARGSEDCRTGNVEEQQQATEQHASAPEAAKKAEDQKQTESASTCFTTHPYAFRNGERCCETDRANDAEKSKLHFQSRSCEGKKSKACRAKPCRSREATEAKAAKAAKKPEEEKPAKAGNPGIRLNDDVHFPDLEGENGMLDGPPTVDTVDELTTIRTCSTNWDCHIGGQNVATCGDNGVCNFCEVTVYPGQAYGTEKRKSAIEKTCRSNRSQRKTYHRSKLDYLGFDNVRSCVEYEYTSCDYAEKFFPRMTHDQCKNTCGTSSAWDR